MTPRLYGPLLISLLAMALMACSPDQTPETDELADPVAPTQAPRPTAEQVPPAAAEGAVAGLSWSVPEAWVAQPQRPMRVATYYTETAEGGSDPGEVAVFYFGPGEGGTVEANVDRWFQQFDQEDGRPSSEVAERETMDVDGIPVTLVRVSGTYNAAAGPMAPRADLRPGYRLIGAIAEGPQGAVFFKFTGPEATVEQEESRFMSMVESIRKL
ncbi:hypothetical protein [Thioalkalivibrio sp.]|uniref:hypothetical protein n=1 Tax=Thioalkalivibrio sp. TaxID=2093813 RepID=UPI003976B7E5